jgi:hypothetical protein
LKLLAAQVTGALAFGALGLAIGAAFRGNAAPGVVNLVFLPTAALGGLWFPMSFMPGFVQVLALFLPTFNYGELARVAAGIGGQAVWMSLAGIIGWTTIGVLIAWWAVRQHQLRIRVPARLHPGDEVETSGGQRQQSTRRSAVGRVEPQAKPDMRASLRRRRNAHDGRSMRVLSRHATAATPSCGAT